MLLLTVLYKMDCWRNSLIAMQCIHLTGDIGNWNGALSQALNRGYKFFFYSGVAYLKQI